MKIKIINYSNNSLPKYMSKGASGMDLQAFIPHNIKIYPFERKIINTGLKIEIPIGYEAQIRSRSGLVINYGIICLNSPGTIDSDYRGEIMVILMNLSSDIFIVKSGDRIAQIVISYSIHVTWNNNNKLNKTIRNKSGLGSTGI